MLGAGMLDSKWCQHIALLSRQSRLLVRRVSLAEHCGGCALQPLPRRPHDHGFSTEPHSGGEEGVHAVLGMGEAPPREAVSCERLTTTLTIIEYYLSLTMTYLCTSREVEGTSRASNNPGAELDAGGGVGGLPRR